MLLLACIATGVTGVLHVVFLRHAGGLWRDERANVGFASMASWSEFAANLHLDNFPPLYRVLLAGWIAFAGEGDFAIRVLGCATGLTLIAAFWASARLLGVGAPLVSVSLAASSPLVLQAGDWIRPYGLGAAAIVLAFGLLWRVANGGTGRETVAAAVATVLSVQLLYQNAFFVAGMGVCGLVVARKSRSAATRVAVVCALAAASLLPYVDLIRRGAEHGAVTRTGTDPGRLLDLGADALGAGGTPAAIGWIALAALAILGAAAAIRNGSGSRAAYAAGASLAGISLTVVFLVRLGMPGQPWYLVTSIAVAASALDAILLGSASRWVRYGAACAALAVAAAQLPAAWVAAHTRQTNLDLVAARIAAEADEEDFVVVDPWYYGITFQHAYRGAAPSSTVPPLADLRIHRYDLLREQLATAEPLQPLIDRIASTLRAGGRVFLVGGLTLPVAGETPPHYQPAPDPEIGWSELHYAASWSLQIGEFLSRHGRTAGPVEVPVEQPVNRYEEAPVVVVEGWRSP